MANTGTLRLSQSPSLLISGSGSWPQREALALSLAFAAENIKSLPLAQVKILSSTCRQV